MADLFHLKNEHPRKDFTSITQVGLKAYDLADAHQTVIDARLPGARTRLMTDLTALGAVVPGAMLARQEAKVATSAQNAAVQKGYKRVKAIRLSVRKAGAPRDVQQAYGVGQKTQARVVRDVKAGLQQIVDRAALVPEEAAALGLTAEAVAELQTCLVALTDADTTQETKRARAPLSTKERNVTARRVLQTAALIAGAGMLAFVDDPLVHTDFAALMASTKQTGASKDKRAVEATTPTENEVAER